MCRDFKTLILDGNRYDKYNFNFLWINNYEFFSLFMNQWCKARALSITSWILARYAVQFIISFLQYFNKFYQEYYSFQ